MHLQNFKGHVKSRYVNIDKVIGSNLKYIRVNANVSQMELAAHLGITFQQIQKYENGSSRISCSILYVMSNFLDVSVLSFFAGLHLEKKAIIKITPTNKDADFLNDFNQLPFELKQSLRKMVKRLIRDG